MGRFWQHLRCEGTQFAADRPGPTGVAAAARQCAMQLGGGRFAPDRTKFCHEKYQVITLLRWLIRVIVRWCAAWSGAYGRWNQVWEIRSR